MSKSLTTSQEQLSVQVMEIVRLEQTRRRLITQLNDTMDRIASRDEEIAKQNETIGDTQTHRRTLTETHTQQSCPCSSVVNALGRHVHRRSSLCLFIRTDCQTKIAPARITKLDTEVFHHKSWKSFIFGVQESTSRSTEIVLAWVFALR